MAMPLILTHTLLIGFLFSDRWSRITKRRYCFNKL